jgi:retinol dehydrogenase 12
MDKLAIGGIVSLGLMNRYFNGGKNVHSPNLKGKIVVITGANTGIGFETAKFMANLKPKKIVFACRSEERANDAINQIKKEINCGDSLEFMALDLNDLNSVKQFGNSFKYDKIDILINNAGVMALPSREETTQGFEKQFGVNHLGHFLLTKLLLDKVKAAPEGRIVVLSSRAHERGQMNWDDIHFKK